jgi:hypothetical protein
MFAMVLSTHVFDTGGAPWTFVFVGVPNDAPFVPGLCPECPLECQLGQPELLADWTPGNFSPSSEALGRRVASVWKNEHASATLGLAQHRPTDAREPAPQPGDAVPHQPANLEVSTALALVEEVQRLRQEHGGLTSQRALRSRSIGLTPTQPEYIGDPVQVP